MLPLQPPYKLLFFIEYLGFKDHEMDFELNLIFPSQVFRHFENFRVLFIFSIDQM